MRPRIKHTHRPVRMADGEIRIGGSVDGLADVLETPQVWAWDLLESLDGSKTVEQVSARLREAHPDLAPHVVAAAVDDLVRAGHVEDADERSPTGLSRAELDRYSRGMALLSWMAGGPPTEPDPQSRLGEAKVSVLGLGGVGCTAALALVLSGVGHVHCVDRDLVAWSDLNRQVLYGEDDLGLPKTEVAVRKLSAANSGVLVTGEHRDVDGPGSVARLIADCDVLLLAADAPADIRSWVNQACLDSGTPWVLGGYQGPLVTVGLFRPGTGPCYECLRLVDRSMKAVRPVATEWSPGIGRRAPHAANAVTSGMTGLLAAHGVMSMVTGVPALGENRQHAINLITVEGARTITPAAPHPRCPACGPDSA
ncbi:HesA/MoeB/ThiF family protein [Actinokineospora inagensis]|uniref:HesA/MoeB/ThiF family protein n=1 Tax=Actinokineospora inagensis TaxID=103730 RepID=UPI000556C34E|nr:ThiF family adenylyltransferase [Actinokineospora inagensis]